MDEPRGRRWPVTWEASRRDQLRTALRSTPEQRLEWLEQAMRLALEAKTGHGVRRAATRPPR